MSKTLHNAFATLRLLRKVHLLYERNFKENQLKMMDREEKFQRHLKFFGNDEAEKVAFLYDQQLLTMQLEFCQEKINATQRSFQEVENWIHQHEHECTLLGEAAAQLKEEVQLLRLNLQVADLQQHSKHIKYIFYLKNKQHKLTCKLLHALLAAHQRQCQTLKAAGLPVGADQKKLLGYEDDDDDDDDDDNDETTLEWTEIVEDDTPLQPILEFSPLTLAQNTPVPLNLEARNCEDIS